MITSNTDILSMMIKQEKINYALELKRTKYLILVQDLERAFAAPPRDGRSAAQDSSGLQRKRSSSCTRAAGVEGVLCDCFLSLLCVFVCASVWIFFCDSRNLQKRLPYWILFVCNKLYSSPVCVFTFFSATRGVGV